MTPLSISREGLSAQIYLRSCLKARVPSAIFANAMMTRLLPKADGAGRW